METPEDYCPKTFVEEVRGQYRACFKIGVQTFFVCEREDKAEAEWYVGCLKTAFTNYALYLGHAHGKWMADKDKEIALLKEEISVHKAINGLFMQGDKE